jgi:hypothetical protein
MRLYGRRMTHRINKIAGRLVRAGTVSQKPSMVSFELAPVPRSRTGVGEPEGSP